MTTWVGQFSVTDGQVREHGPWLVDRERRREDESLRLLVLAEPADPRSGEFCHEVADAVAVLFARESLSITGGILRALRQAHANLSEWNRRSLREHRVAVGVTCAVIRGDEVLIAQAGPGAAYLRRGTTVRRLGTEELTSSIALGSAEPIEPLFTSASLLDSDVLLISSNGEAACGRRTIEVALRAGPERALAELFPHMRSLADTSAVLVADLDLDPDAEPQAVPPLDLPEDEDPAAVEGREVSLTGLDDEPPEPRDGGSRRRSGRLQVVGGRRGSGRGLPSVRNPRPPAGTPSGQRRRAATTGGGALAALGLGSGGPLRSGAIALAVVAAIVLLAWLVLPNLVAEDRAGELDGAITAAAQAIATAEATDDAGARRDALEAALVEVERARSIDASDSRIAGIEARAQTGLDALNAVIQVDALQRIVTFEGTVTAPVEPVDLVSGGGRLWLLESGRGRVLRIDPVAGGDAPDPVEVFRAGEVYPALDAAVAGAAAGAAETGAREPTAIAWDASTSRLLVLDGGRTLYAVSASGDVTSLPLRDAQEMRSVDAIAVYLGNLYLLDGVAGEVWRYLPAAEGFDSERDGLLGGVEFEDARGLAVDGDIFVLDGQQVRRFGGGLEGDPVLQGIDEPPVAAAGLTEDVLREVFYLADRGHARIVAGSPAGPFLRQYRHPDFASLVGVAVSGDGQFLYALSTTGIDRFPTASSAASGG